MRLIQFDRHGRAAVGQVDADTVTELRVPAGMGSDEALIGLAMGDLVARPAADPVDLTAVRPRPPVRRPPSIRDFLLFEQHFANGLRPFGRAVPQAWYRQPSFYFTCPATVLGHGDVLAPPRSDQLDYELELAVVIGRRLRDPSREEALHAIAGFALFNDFSLRDVQARERPIGLGPMKSKDFASALGPYLVTPDELGTDLARPAVTLTAAVNGEVWSCGQSEDMHFDLAEAIVEAARDCVVVPGDVIATGTVPTGCVLELTAIDAEGPYRWLRPGDEVVLAAPQLGTLVTTIGPARQIQTTEER